MSRRLLVIADDFTGSLDAAVHFASGGISTIVSTRWDDIGAALVQDPTVLAVDTESRHLDPNEAAARVRRTAAQGLSAGFDFLYKKTDSTLRGNIGAELSALMEAGAGEALAFVPALPKAGRTTVGGAQYLDGLPINRTHFARDPRDPVTEADISTIIRGQSAVQVEVIPRGGGARGHDRGTGGFRERAIQVFDAETDEDIEEIARSFKAGGVPRLLAGCSGFAEQLSQLLDLEPSQNPAPAAPLTLPAAIVCGSLNEVSLEQVRRAERAGIRSRGLPLGLSEGAYHETALRLAGLIEQDGVAILKTDAPGGNADGPLLASGDLRIAAVRPAISRAFRAIVAELVSRCSLRTLVLVGGDTGFDIMDGLGLRELQPVRELSQGTVVSRAPLRDRPLTIVTKAGGFGPPDLLVSIRAMLRAEKGGT